MKKVFDISNLIPVLVVLVGGTFFVALSWLAYYGIYMSVETLFYSADPTQTPTDSIRNASALALVIVYLAFTRLKSPELVKATVLVAPMTVILITIVLALYSKPIYAIPLFLAIVGGCVFVLYRSKKAWFFYYAVAISIVLSLLYAWPR